jgi:hypothetical protein
MSKGSKRRPVDERYCSKEQADKNWERIFSKGKKKDDGIRPTRDEVSQETKVQENT